jgi:hypothetical protein
MNRFTRQPIAEQPLPIEVRETLRQLREAHKK